MPAYAPIEIGARNDIRSGVVHKGVQISLTEEKIVEEVEKRRDELVDLLKVLIGFPSENEGIPGTGKETEVQSFVYDRLVEWGFDRVEKVDCPDSKGRPNIVGTTPSLMKAGEYLGAVPGYASITYVVWYPNWLKEEDVAMEIKRRVLSLSETDDWLKENPPEFVYPTLQHWKPFKTSLDHEGVKLLGSTHEEVLGTRPVFSASRFVSDGTFFQEKGIPSVLIGPGGLNMSIHGPDEYVPIEELAACSKTYALFAYRWCNGIA